MLETMNFMRGRQGYFSVGNWKNVRMDTDIRLAWKLRKGGRSRDKALGKLMFRHQSMVESIAKRLFGLSTEDGKDAYLEAVMVLVENIIKGKFRGESALGTYLGGIMKNKCRQIQKRNERQQDAEAKLAEDMKHESRREEGRFAHEQSVAHEYQKLLIIFDQLNEGCKELLLDWGYFGKTPKEIAEDSKLNDATVRSRKKRCLEELMEHYPDGTPQYLFT